MCAAVCGRRARGGKGVAIPSTCEVGRFRPLSHRGDQETNSTRMLEAGGTLVFPASSAKGRRSFRVSGSSQRRSWRAVGGDGAPRAPPPPPRSSGAPAAAQQIAKKTAAQASAAARGRAAAVAARRRILQAARGGDDAAQRRSGRQQPKVQGGRERYTQGADSSSLCGASRSGAGGPTRHNRRYASMDHAGVALGSLPASAPPAARGWPCAHPPAAPR